MPSRTTGSRAAFRDRDRRTTVTATRASISTRTGQSACQDPYEDHPHIMQMRMLWSAGRIYEGQG